MNKYKVELLPNNQPCILLGYVEAKNKSLALKKVFKEHGIFKDDVVIITRVTSDEYNIHLRLTFFDAVVKEIRDRIKSGCLIPNLNMIKQI